MLQHELQLEEEPFPVECLARGRMGGRVEESEGAIRMQQDQVLQGAAIEPLALLLGATIHLKLKENVSEVLEEDPPLVGEDLHDSGHRKAEAREQLVSLEKGVLGGVYGSAGVHQDQGNGSRCRP